MRLALAVQGRKSNEHTSSSTLQSPLWKERKESDLGLLQEWSWTRNGTMATLQLKWMFETGDTLGGPKRHIQSNEEEEQTENMTTSCIVPVGIDVILQVVSTLDHTRRAVSLYNDRKRYPRLPRWTELASLLFFDPIDDPEQHQRADPSSATPG